MPLTSDVPVRIRCTFNGQTGRIFGVVRSSLSNVWRETIERKIKTTLFPACFRERNDVGDFFRTEIRRFSRPSNGRKIVSRKLGMHARGKCAHAFSYNGWFPTRLGTWTAFVNFIPSTTRFLRRIPIATYANA